MALVWLLKMTEYQIQGIHSNSSSFFLPVINVEAAKTATRFFAFWGTCLHSDVFACRYSTWRSSDPRPYPYLSLLHRWHSPQWLERLLANFLALFRDLGLRLISGRGVMGLSLFFIVVGSFVTVLPIGVFPLLFDQWAIALWAFGINLPNIVR